MKYLSDLWCKDHLLPRPHVQTVTRAVAKCIVLGVHDPLEHETEN